MMGLAGCGRQYPARRQRAAWELSRAASSAVYISAAGQNLNNLGSKPAGYGAGASRSAGVALSLSVSVKNNDAAPPVRPHAHSKYDRTLALRLGRRDSLSKAPNRGPEATVARSKLPLLRTRPTLASSRRTGYVIAGTLREQQTRSAMNLAALQCWAKTLFVHVVEPFMNESRLLVPLNGEEDRLIRFRDVFDIDYWNDATTSQGYAPLASWEQFLREAPRELIVVHVAYTSRSLKQARQGRGEPVVHHPTNNKYMEGCSTGTTSELEHLLKHNFTVAREVCFNFRNGDELNLFQFNRHLFGDLRPKRVTVYFEEWRGFAGMTNGKRLVVNDACLSNGATVPNYIQPSRRLIGEARKYQNTVIGSKDYIALIVRTEKVILQQQEHKVFKNLARCLNLTMDALGNMKRATGLENVVLSMDIGKYGSHTGMQPGSSRYRELELIYENFINKVYGKSESLMKWEQSFETVTSIREPGYIGMLQKAVSVQAKCVIFVGGGSFQRHAKYLYETLHSKERCIHIVDECSKNFNKVRRR